jgi:hypothetical protein
VEEIIKKAEEAVKSSQSEYKRDETTKLVSSTKAKIEEGRELGADVSEAEELLKEAENMLLTDFDFDTVENLVKKSQSSLASSWDEYHGQRLIDDISRIHGKIVEFREMGVNITEAELLLHQAEVEYKKNKFENVDNLLGKINEIVEVEYDEHFVSRITLLINDVQTLIAQAQERNLDVQVGKDILQKAIQEFENKNYPKAEELAKKAKDVLTNIIESSEVEEVKSLIDRVYNLINDAKSLNIDASPAERLFRQAEALYKAKEFESAKEYAYKSETILNSLAEKYVKDFNPNLTVEVVSPELIVHKWNRFSIKILNDGRISAQDVIVDFKGDIETKGKKKVPVIAIDGSAELEIGLKSPKAGDVEVKLFMHCVRPFDKNEYDFSETFTIRLLDPGKFVVQDVFVIYQDGCLILHRSREFREMVDDDIFSSMLIAVQNFISDSFGRSPDEGIKRLDFGRNKILIETGPEFFLASVIEGEEPGLLPVYMVEVINEIQEQFGGVLEDWDGYLEKLEGIGDIIDKLLNIKIIEGTHDVKPTSIDKGGGTIDSVKSMIDEAKEQGIDTSEAELALNKAESMVESSDYSAVWNQVKAAEEKVREARRDHYQTDVKSAIETVKEMLSEAKNYGANVEDAEVIYTKLRDLVEKEQYPQALEMAENTKVAIKVARDEKDTNDNFSNMNDNIAIVSDWGLEPKDYSDEKEEISEALNNKDFETANTIITKVNNDIKEEVIKKPMEILPYIYSVNKNIDDLGGYGIEMDDAEEKMLSAKDAIYNLEFSRANQIIQDVNTKATAEKNNFLQSKTVDTINNVKETIVKLQKMNLSVDEAETLLADAEEKFTSKDYEGAYAAITSSERLIDEVSHSHQSKPILKTIISTERILNQAKLHGADQDQIQNIDRSKISNS